MRFILLLLILVTSSCANERVLQLPEIEHATVTEVLDVSPAYIFYDEKQPDSTLLNRKNLISTTNWLVNVDKRLTLRQAMPHIKFLQDKKRNAEMHKNENAKNYFSCNDTSISNLGFIEFTDINYEIITLEKDGISEHNAKQHLTDDSLISEKSIPANYLIFDSQNQANAENLITNMLKSLEDSIPFDKNIKLMQFSFDFYYDSELSFQDYISIKSKIQTIAIEKVIIETNEFIY
ncbi:MAG: hypothetical protein NWP87_03210 [Winogradskyella sp.]|nr:hypothetical protein [Winogradskyella sp.]